MVVLRDSIGMSVVMLIVLSITTLKALAAERKQINNNTALVYKQNHDPVSETLRRIYRTGNPCIEHDNPEIPRVEIPVGLANNPRIIAAIKQLPVPAEQLQTQQSAHTQECDYRAPVPHRMIAPSIINGDEPPKK